MNTIPLAIVYQGMLLKGYANPIQKLTGAIPTCMLVYIQGWCIGTLCYKNGKWSIDQPIDPEFVIHLGTYIHSHVSSIKKAMHYRGK